MVARGGAQRNPWDTDRPPGRNPEGVTRITGSPLRDYPQLLVPGLRPDCVTRITGSPSRGYGLNTWHLPGVSPLATVGHPFGVNPRVPIQPVPVPRPMTTRWTAPAPGRLSE